MSSKFGTSSQNRKARTSDGLSADESKTDGGRQNLTRNQAKDSVSDFSEQAKNSISDTNIKINNNKANTCDRLSKMLLEGASSDDKRPILRVNLIKKSSRPLTSFPTHSLNRQRNSSNLQSRPKTAADLAVTCETATKTVETNPKSSKETNQEPMNTKISMKVTDAKPPQNPKKFPAVKNKVIGKQAGAKVEKPVSDVNKSKKLVMSMIRDLSKTISNEDLDEMLSEINTVIGEIKNEEQNQSKTNSSSNTTSISKQTSDQKLATKAKLLKPLSGGNLERGSRKTAERRQDQLSDIRANKVRHVSTCSSEASNCSEYYVDQSSVLEEKEPKKRIVSDTNRRSSKDTEKSANEDDNMQSIDDSKRKLRQFVIDLSSDEDTIKSSLSTRPPKSATKSKFPDRCLRITSSHAKYISPHRKRSLEDRLSRAQEAREKFLEYRANKFREILRKVEEMRAWKEEDTLNLKASVQNKLQKAAEKREEQLDKIIRKAHDEDLKVSEIHFINNLEAQNRRHDLNSRKREFEARLQDLQEERQRRFEEKQAKEVAAEERRKTLEAERKAKLIEIQQRRKLKDQKVEQQQQVKERKRLEKTRDRDQKISAIKEAYSAGVQTLRKRINQKQEQSERRHEINLRLVRQKAFELSIKRYNSFRSEARGAISLNESLGNLSISGKYKDLPQIDGQKRGLQLKPFNTKKFCNLCQEIIGSEAALFSHLRSENHHSSINEHYGHTMLTTNEVVEIHNLRHIVDTDKPLEDESIGNNTGTTSGDDQQSSRASSLVNYYHSSYLSQANGGIDMSESDRDSLLAIERKCRKLRHKLIVAGKPFSRDWFTNKIRSHLAQLVIKQRVARKQTTNTDASSLASTIDLSANNSICQQNKPYYLKINRITRELLSVATNQRISGGGLMPAGIIHSVDRLLADLSKQLTSRKVPRLSPELLYLRKQQQQQVQAKQTIGASQSTFDFDPDQLSMATKMIEFYAIDTLYLYDIVACLIAILKRMVPNVSLTSKLPSTVASHYSTLLDPISLNSYYCHRSPVLPTRIYIRMIGMIQNLCCQHSDLCYIIFHSNNMIYLSDILSYRLGFIIGNESPASSVSGSSSAATLSAHTIEQHQNRTKLSGGKSSSSSASVSRVLPSNVTVTRPSNANCSAQKQHPSNHNCNGEGYNGSYIDGDQGNESNDCGDSKVEDEEDQNQEDDESFWMEDRAETYKRTEDVVDDMTAGLCKLLATVTETILSRPLVLLNQLDKSAFAKRSDDFISYMVSVGIVDTESVIMSHVHHHQQQQQLHSESINSTITTGGFGADHQRQTNLAASSSSDLSVGSNTNSNATVNSLSASHKQQQQQQQQQQHQLALNLATNGTVQTTSNNQSATQAPVAVSGKIINFTTSCVQFVTSLVKLIIAKLPDDPEDFCAQLGGNVAATIGDGDSKATSGDSISTSTLTGRRSCGSDGVGGIGSNSQTKQTDAGSQGGSNGNNNGDGHGSSNKRACDFSNSLIQQDQTQLLATLKLTQLSGVLTLVYDLLVQSFKSLASQPDNSNLNSNLSLQLPLAAPTSASLSNNNGFGQDISSQDAAASVAAQLGLALASLRLINYVAYIDVRLIQATLAADEMLPMQLRHVCSYLISYLVASGFKPMEPMMSIANSRLDDQLVSNNNQYAPNISNHQQQQQHHHQQQQQQHQRLQSDQKAQFSKGRQQPHRPPVSGQQSEGSGSNLYQNQQEQQRQLQQQNQVGDQLKSELISEIILLIGHFAHLNEGNQLMLKSGRQPTIIELLVGLPFDYFARDPLKTILMPTLISCSFQNEQICSLLCRELNLTMLTSFIGDQILSSQLESRQQAAAAAVTNDRPHPLVTDELTSTKLALNRWRFERRFAKSKWLSAKKYFETQQAKRSAANRKGVGQQS